MKKENTAPADNKKTEYSLNDDRRVKVLSPGALVAKRFFRNRLAVTGLVVLLAMFAFSFLGGVLSPYKQDQKFYRVEQQSKAYAGVVRNEEWRYTAADAAKFTGIVQAQTFLAITKGETAFSYSGVDYTLEKLADRPLRALAGKLDRGLEKLRSSSLFDKL